MTDTRQGRAGRFRLVLLAALALVLAIAGARGLAGARSGLERALVSVDGIPVELITPAERVAGPLPGVVVVHGFSGSRQLMYGIAQSLARNGYAAAVLDLPGHGQHPARMAMQPGGFDEPLSRVVRWLRAQPGVDGGRLALVGHSMGAGAVLRFAAGDPGVLATVAVSTGLAPRGAVLPNEPRSVLAMAGAWEFPNVLGACRGIVTASYPQADPMERQGTWADGTARQCVVVPGVEHIGVLFSEPATTTVIRWLDAALDAHPPGRQVDTAIPMMPALLLHGAATVLFLLLAAWLFPRPAATRPDVDARPLPALVVPGIVAGAALVAALVMRVVPSGWLPLLTADYLCGFFGITGLATALAVRATGRPVARPLPSFAVAWRVTLLATVVLGLFGLVAQLSWLNVLLVGPRRWLAVVAFPAWLLYFLSLDALLRTRPRREYLAWWAGAAVVTMAGIVGAVFTLRAPFFLLLLGPALLPVLLWLGVHGHGLRPRAGSSWPAACVAAALVAWLVAAVFPLV
jgi:dienelactone hydrolase